MLYEEWRKAMLEMSDRLPDRMCPFCEEVYDDIAEYVDVGCGGRGVQVTPNHCENPDCGAWEQGAYTYSADEYEFAFGWVRPKYESPSGPRETGNVVMDFISNMDVKPEEKAALRKATVEAYNNALSADNEIWDDFFKENS